MIRKLIRESIKKILKENSISFKAGEYGSSKPHTLGCDEDGMLIIDGQKYVAYKVKFGLEVPISVDNVYMSDENIMLKGSFGVIDETVPLLEKTVLNIVEKIEDPSFDGVFSFKGSKGDTFIVKRQN